MAASGSDRTNSGSDYIFKINVVVWLASAILVLLVQFIFQSPDTALEDFPALYTESRLALHGQGADMYDTATQLLTEMEIFPHLDQKQATKSFFHPPMAVVFWLPLGLIPVDAARYFWFVLLAVMPVAALAVVWRAQGLGTPLFLAAAQALALYGPLVDCIAKGQPVPLVLMGEALFIWWQMRNGARGAGLSLVLFLIKPQLALPILAFLIGARRYKTVCWFGLAMVGVVLVSLVIPGVQSYFSYFELMKSSLFGNPVLLMPELNPTFRGQMLRVFDLGSLQSEWIFDFSAAIMVIAYVGCFALGRHLAQRPQWLERGLLLVLPVGLVTAFHVHNFDLLLLTPLFIILARCWRFVPGIVRAATLLSGLLLCQLLYAPLGEVVRNGGVGVVNIYFIMLLILSVCFGVFIWKDKLWTQEISAQ